MAHKNALPRRAQLIQAILFIIIVLIPFHALLTTWLGSNFGHLLAWRAWKEVLIFVAALSGVSLLFTDKKFRKDFFTDRINQVMIVFALWVLCTAAVNTNQPQPLLLGLTIQLRLMMVFLLARLVSYYRPPSHALLEKLLLIPAVGVILFGFVQVFALPFDFLRHLGYKKGVTIPPYFTIDEQLDKLRYASTLRGPNPLGVYLLMSLSLALQALLKRIKRAQNAAVLLAGLVVLYSSHSRGAWIAAAVTLGLTVLLNVSKKLQVAFVATSVVVALVSGFVIYNARNTSFVQNVVLHNNPNTGGAVDSNEGHETALKASINEIRQRPVTGCGAGCAGPASQYNKNGPKLAENYYLQTAEEAGVVGLVLLLAIFCVVGSQLYKQRANQLGRVLLVSFIGVGVASLFAHAWADDTIAYLWWSLAGFVLYTDAVRNQHGKKKTKIA